MTLSELLASKEEKKILLLGREGIFSAKEIARFFKKYNAVITTEPEDGVTAVVENAVLNPFEEDISNDAYDKGLTLYKLKDLEKILSESINDDELLMGIKLANDQGRIFRLLGNEHINNTLFVKLLSLYEWDDEEEDSREDRDVIMYTLRRYIDIRPNEEDLLYSYLTLRRLASEASDPQLLLALMGFPNFTFLIRGREKVSLRETIARNLHIDEEGIRKLLSFRDNKVYRALAGNTTVPLAVLKQLMDRNDEEIYKALAVNSSIDDEIFTALLEKGEEVAALLLLHQPLNPVYFTQIEKAGLDENIFALIGGNEFLSDDLLTTLLETENDALLAILSANRSLSSVVLEHIYQLDRPLTFVHLAGNPFTRVWILQALYDEYADSEDILVALARNTSAPERMLRILFEKEDLEINRGLATNASLPSELLEVLKIDTRLQNELAQNEVLARSYEQTLDYDKKAVQF